MFHTLTQHTNDPIEALFQRLSEDRSPDKIDLGIGVFRDERGRVPVMQAVREAERQLLARDLPKSYLSPLGNQDYCRDIEALALGTDHAVVRDDRIVSAQTPGAGSALRAAAELIAATAPGATVWASRPVWAHQLEFFEQAGLPIRYYRYYDQGGCALQFDAMLDDLEQVRANDVLLLHGCCHNPTGEDLDLGQWRAVAELATRKGAVPLVDVAYQGFGRGIEDDVAGLRLVADAVPQMLLVVSSSKSFGIYRERAGLLSVILAPAAGNAGPVRRTLRDTVRRLYFMAPDHGAAVVHEILSTPQLAGRWREELDAVRNHVGNMRAALRETIEAANPDFDAAFLTRQQGMFSCLPVSEHEQRRMETAHHIYMLPNARVNVAAMNSRQSRILANAFAEVRNARHDGLRRAGT